MTGTLLNIGAVLIGGLVGLAFGRRFPERSRETVVAGMGLFVTAIGLRMFLETQNPLYPLGGIVVGGLVGEALGIEGALEGLGTRLEAATNRGRASTSADFARGFLAASLLFCVGPMTILGSIQDGLTGDYQLLAIKSVLDGFAAMALASTLGVGVLFSVVVVLVYQGGLTLFAAQAQSLLTAEMTAEMTAVGGVLMLSLAVSSLLEVKKIRTGNLLPALLISPGLVALVGWLNSVVR